MTGPTKAKEPTESNETSKKNATNKLAPKPIEYNPRFRGYSFIALTSIINLSSLSNIAASDSFRGKPGIAAAFAAVTLLFALVVLALDRTQLLIEKFHFMKAMDGYFEGYTLIFFTLLWICLTAFITQVDGVGYLTMNIYFSTWLTLASVVYTLNEWSASKDILSIGELTGVSATLKSWYVLFLSSLVVMGTCINYLAYTGSEQSGQGDASLGLAVGIASTVLSFGWICVHYNFIQFCSEGGWTELLFCGTAVLVWIVATAVITKEGGVGSTIVGNGCDAGLQILGLTGIENCTVTVYEPESNLTTSVSCAELAASVNVNAIPGSNLYVFLWLALGSSIHIAFRWKAQQALQFAQAQSRKAEKQAEEEEEKKRVRQMEDDDDDEFEDVDDDY